MNDIVPYTAEEIQNTPMIFVLGVGRSGTTLLQECMGAHPNIITAFECDFILYLYPKFGKISKWTEKDIDEFVDALFSLPPIPHIWLLKKDVLKKALLDILSIANYSTICKTVFYQMAENKHPVSLISDKIPYYSIFAEKLLGIFPEARFIHIVRDPRDTVNARIKRLHKKNTFFACRMWVGFNKAIEHVKAKMPERFFSVPYEEMVARPEETFKALCLFLKLPYSDAMLHHKFAEKMGAHEETGYLKNQKTIHQNLLNPINTDNVKKWEKEMSPLDVAITEKITGKYAKEKYGYDALPKQNAPSISVTKLFASKLIYFVWTKFTKFRYNSYSYNRRYKIKYEKIVAYLNQQENNGAGR